MSGRLDHLCSMPPGLLLPERIHRDALHVSQLLRSRLAVADPLPCGPLLPQPVDQDAVRQHVLLPGGDRLPDKVPRRLFLLHPVVPGPVRRVQLVPRGVGGGGALPSRLLLHHPRLEGHVRCLRRRDLRPRRVQRHGQHRLPALRDGHLVLHGLQCGQLHHLQQLRPGPVRADPVHHDRRRRVPDLPRRQLLQQPVDGHHRRLRRGHQLLPPGRHLDHPVHHLRRRDPPQQRVRRHRQHRVRGVRGRDELFHRGECGDVPCLWHMHPRAVRLILLHHHLQHRVRRVPRGQLLPRQRGRDRHALQQHVLLRRRVHRPDAVPGGVLLPQHLHPDAVHPRRLLPGRICGQNPLRRRPLLPEHHHPDRLHRVLSGGVHGPEPVPARLLLQRRAQQGGVQPGELLPVGDRRAGALSGGVLLRKYFDQSGVRCLVLLSRWVDVAGEMRAGIVLQRCVVAGGLRFWVLLSVWNGCASALSGGVCVRDANCVSCV